MKAALTTEEKEQREKLYARIDVLRERVGKDQSELKELRRTVQEKGWYRKRRRIMPGGSLTKTEIAVVGLLKQGLSNEEIASKLGNKPATVKFHIHNAIRRIGVKSREELMNYQPEAAQA